MNVNHRGTFFHLCGANDQEDHERESDIPLEWEVEDSGRMGVQVVSAKLVRETVLTVWVMVSV